ncbi:MmcQ/YjbR family DNA-binding protein, partial [Parvibaculum sp.]|uniref:MmcQ/YjbR family DNA-binding protein n=1 Tax=Parvibaculum sp. TaxID=2024848 RepID=UPI0025F71A6A
FAIGGWSREEHPYITFKVSDLAFDILKEQPGLRPAPYLASRGMKWIQRTSGESMDADALEDYLRESHRIVGAGLPKKVRVQLGLDS